MEDEIMTKVRRIRERILDECGNDTEAYFEHLRKVDASIPEALRITPEDWARRHA